METKFMLVIPPSGDIDQIEFDEDKNKAFEEMQRQASTYAGDPLAQLELVHFPRIDKIMLFVDENATMRAGVPPNERASRLAMRNIHGPAVVCGPYVSGLSLERALEVRKMIDGAL